VILIINSLNLEVLLSFVHILHVSKGMSPVELIMALEFILHSACLFIVKLKRHVLSTSYTNLKPQVS
jgi:hypothetical protein